MIYKKFNKNNGIYPLNIIKLSILFIILFFLIIICYVPSLPNKIFQNQEDDILNSKRKLDIMGITKLNEYGFKHNLTCFKSDIPLYWNNKTDLELEKLKDDIKNRKSAKIVFKNISLLYKREKPKISLIITLYNQGYYINSVYSYIQKQKMNDLEIIFVDDASTDNTTSIIKNLMLFDKRIVYIKNHINRKQFYSINIGVLNSNGEYILSNDPDDLLLNNILVKAYETAKHYNLDIVQFYMFKGMELWKSLKYKSGIICGNTNIRKIFYFSGTRNLVDKLIRKTIFIKSIIFMKKEFFYMDYHVHTDDTIFFGIIHFTNSYGFLEQIGYFFNIDPKRKPKLTTKKNITIIANERLKSLFNIMKYFMIQSDNNEMEKNNIPYKFFKNKVKKDIVHFIKYIDKDFDFYIDTINLYINCPFFKKKKIEELSIFKEIIINQKKNKSQDITNNI